LSLKVYKVHKVYKVRVMRSFMFKYRSVFYLGIVFLLSIIAGGVIFFAWEKTNWSQDNSISTLFLDRSAKAEPIVVMNLQTKKPEQIVVKGVYLTAYSAGRTAKVDEIISLLNSTELNAVVIDIKDYSGKVLYSSGLNLPIELKVVKDQIGNVPQLINKLHQNNIYAIARQTVFQDPILAEKKPEWALKNKQGGLWRDKNGLAWVDPANQEVWNYNTTIAKEAIDLGFDEINFDYVRFPSDGNIGNIKNYPTTDERLVVMGDFFQYLKDELEDQPAWLSIDMFGFVMERDTGLSIGQRLSDAINKVDYICPMMYPSHYPAGYLGLDNPAEYPQAVIENGIKSGLAKFTGSRTKFRPWLQAFDMGAIYGGNKIRAEIDAVEKYSDAGWLLWNAANIYSSDGLKIE